MELKHIITGKDTEGQFSYHLVRIAPGKAIKNHIHETQLETHEVIAGTGVCINDGAEIKYEVGVISIMPAKVPHEVMAGNESLSSKVCKLILFFYGGQKLTSIFTLVEWQFFAIAISFI